MPRASGAFTVYDNHAVVQFYSVLAAPVDDDDDDGISCVSVWQLHIRMQLQHWPDSQSCSNGVW